MNPLSFLLDLLGAFLILAAFILCYVILVPLQP